jgi:hypothetical protein
VLRERHKSPESLSAQQLADRIDESVRPTVSLRAFPRRDDRLYGTLQAGTHSLVRGPRGVAPSPVRCGHRVAVAARNARASGSRLAMTTGRTRTPGESHPSRRGTRARHGRIGPREGCHTTAAPTSELGPAGARCPAAATSSMRAGHRRERSTRRERRLAAMLPGGEPSAWNTALSARSCSARPITACRLLAIGRARPTDNDGWTWRSRFEETTDGPSSSRARYPSRRMLPARYPGRTRSLCQSADGHLAGALVPQGQWTCPYSRKYSNESV